METLCGGGGNRGVLHGARRAHYPHVTVTANGQQKILAVNVDSSLLADGDKEMLEDLLVAAFNDAQRKVEQTIHEKFAGLAGGLNLPPGMKLPF